MTSPSPTLSQLLSDQIVKWRSERAREKQNEPFFVGISGCQGIGKTTVGRSLVKAFEAVGLKAITVSIDDFYLTRAEQEALALTHPGEKYWQARGYPGTHDLILAHETFDALLELGPGETFHLPIYDKAAFSGKGDRAPQSTWPEVKGPIDIVLFDGWMVGYASVSESALPDPALKKPNSKLVDYAPLFKRLEKKVLLEPLQIEFMLDWRIEAEEKMKAERKSGMTESEIRAYVETFLPAHRLYLPIFKSKADAVFQLKKDRTLA